MVPFSLCPAVQSAANEVRVFLTICFIDMTGYQENFVSVVDEDFQCFICNFPLREPLQTRCGHRFCRECLEDASTRFENLSLLRIYHSNLNIKVFCFFHFVNVYFFSVSWYFKFKTERVKDVFSLMLMRDISGVSLTPDTQTKFRS